MDAELQFHIAAYADDLVRKGLPGREAQRRARLEFGAVERAKEECREARGVTWLESLLQDLRYGVRMLVKNPGFTTIAVLTLALGIGFTTAIFSVANAVLIQPLRYDHPDALVLIREGIPKFLGGSMPVSAPDIAIIRRENRVFSGVAAYQSKSLNLAGAGEPRRVGATRVSASLFPVLGASPILGRGFTPDEDPPGHFVTILSYGLWSEQFGRDPAVIGRSIKLDDQAYTVIGVMPRTFEFPPRGAPYDTPAELWVPIAFTKQQLSDLGDNFDIGVIGRLKSGVTLAQARAGMQVVANEVLKSWGTLPAGLDIKLEMPVTPLREFVVSDVRTLLYLLLAAVGFLLLIACANAANLLLSRAAGRRKEITLRAALGARRGRIVSQLLAESVLLAFLGGIFGLFFAFWGTHLLAATAPKNIPQVQRIVVDATVLVFAFLVSIITGLLFGLAPALALSRTNLSEALKQGGRSHTSGRHAQLVRNVFVVAQVAIAFVLVAGAGLLIRSFLRVVQSSSGVRPQNVITATVALPLVHYPDAASANLFLQRVFADVQSLPGIESIGASTDLPTEVNWNHVFTVEDEPQPRNAMMPLSWHSLVAGDYFRTLGIALIQGRFFSPAEVTGESKVVIISAGMARRYWPLGNAVGKRIKWGPAHGDSPWLTVVGVVGDVKQTALDQPSVFHTYSPYLQDCTAPIMTHGSCSTLHVAIRASVPPASAIGELRSAVQRFDPAEPLTAVRTLSQVLQSSIAPRMFNTFLLVIFAGAAVLLAAVGVYGVLAYRVAQQINEVGVRLALGARPADVLRLVFGQGVRLSLLGTVIGVGGAIALTRLMASLLFSVSPTDPLTFLAVAVFLLFVSLLACYVPARRAIRVDPMAALRYE